MKNTYKPGDAVYIKIVVLKKGIPEPDYTNAVVRHVFPSGVLCVEAATVPGSLEHGGLMYITEDRIIKPVGNCTEEAQSNKHGCGSCMRISDSEIFYVGTELTVGKITAMEWDKMYAGGMKFNINNEPDYWVAIEVAEKVQARKKLFQTEDGVDIYKGDKYIYVDKFWSIHECPGASGENKTSKKFTTRAAAKEYIVWNKPCLSFTDVEIYLDPAAMRPLQDFIRKKLGL